jgi:hypothetical protein
LDASKRGSAQEQTSVRKSVVKNPSNNKLHNLELFVFTTRRQPNQLQLSFIDVNTKPEGDWTPANVGQHNSRPENQLSSLSKAGVGNSKASKLSKLSSLMAERFVKGSEQVSLLELLQKSNKNSLQYRLNLTLVENILSIHVRHKQE